MLIGVTMRVMDAGNYREPRDAISHDWVRWLEDHGHSVIAIPNAAASPERYLDHFAPDGVIFTGGNDLMPGAAEGGFSELRNAAESRLLVAAIERSLPILGVCRGLHLINRHFGGAIEADITGGTIEHVAATHCVSITAPFRQLAGGAAIETNSYHHQGVVRGALGQGLVDFARSEPDGLVEGLHHTEKPILAVQWHPERANPAFAFDDAMVQTLFTQGAFWLT